MPDDYTSTIQTAGSVTVGGSATGNIETEGDRDWFAVTLEAGVTYRIDLQSSVTGGGTLSDPYLRGIHDANGELIPGTTNYAGGISADSLLTFTAEEAGTYYIAAGAWGSYTGTYTLSVTDISNDDYAAGTETTGAVEVGGSARGDIETAHDRDWFAVVLEAGKTYRIDLEGATTGDGTLLDPYLRGVHDSDGEFIAGTTDNRGGHSMNSRVVFTVDEAGTYYVAAGGNGTVTGSYTLSVTDVSPGVPDDYTAGTDTTGAAAVGGSATGNIETASDRDWFAVTLEAGKSYRIDLEGAPTGRGSLENAYLRGVHDSDGNLLSGTTDDNGGDGANSRAYFTATAAGTYYVAAGAYESHTGAYTLSVTEVSGDHAAGTDTTGRVAVGGSAAGDIESRSDRDWFAVALEADKTYVIDLEGSPTGGGTLPDTYLRGVHDSDGNLLAGTTNDDGGYGFNSRLVFTAPEAGTWYVAAGAYGANKGSYTLSVTELSSGADDDFAGGSGTTGTVAVGGSATGEIETSHDRDWFAVALEAGRTYRIDLEGSPTGGGTLSDAFLRGVHNASGVFLSGTTNDDGGEGYNSRLIFTASEAGTYYVAAGAYNEKTGSYTLSVTEIAADLAAGTDTTGTVAVGGSATGNIENAYDRDWFAVTLEAGRTYRFDLEGSRTDAGTLHNPYLRGLHDPNGHLLSGTINDNGGEGYNSRLVFTAQQNGTYYAAAGGSYSDTGTYTLSVTETTANPDDYAGGAGTTGSVAVGGSTTGNIENAYDRDWFTATLEAGKSYRIDLEGSWTNDGTLSSPYLRGVHDADGNLISGTTDNNGGDGYNSLVVFVAEEAGTYYVAAGAAGTVTGTYTLSVTEIPADLAAGTSTTGAVAVGGSATGELETSGDRDWFAVTLEAGKTYVIDLEGWDTGAGTLVDPYLRGVHDADGNLLSGTAINDGGYWYNSQLVFTAAEDGTYYVAAGADGSDRGTYRLSVTEFAHHAISGDDYTAGTDTIGAVAVGGSATGEIETADDRDWFAVTLEAGGRYVIDLEGVWTGRGFLQDPYLYGVHDSDGNLLPGTTNEDGGYAYNSRLSFTAAEAGTYYVAAGASGDNAGSYTLSVEEAL